MYKRMSGKSLTLFLVLFSVLLISAGGVFGVQNEECCLYMEKPDCPARYTSLNQSQEIYSPGETVKITLSGLKDEYLMEEIEIQKVGAEREVVYTEVINEPVPGDVSEWSWEWNQIGNSGEQVDNHRYFALLETQCCGIYRTDFIIQRQVRPRCSCNCCGAWSTRLSTPCNRYESGENVAFNFSNCSNCDVTFERVYIIKKTSSCCGGTETVFSHEFSDGFDPGKSWSWNWGQVGNDGNLVGPGRYTMVIDVECCSSLKTSFTIYERRDCCSRSDCCQSNCCGGLFSFFLSSCCSDC
ncbi:MAG: hypothetical protein V5A83_05995 [Candidatus Bipolaricaulota bacterium]